MKQFIILKSTNVNYYIIQFQIREFTHELQKRLDEGATDEEIKKLIKDQVNTIYRLVVSIF